MQGSLPAALHGLLKLALTSLAVRQTVQIPNCIQVAYTHVDIGFAYPEQAKIVLIHLSLVKMTDLLYCVSWTQQ